MNFRRTTEFHQSEAETFYSNNYQEINHLMQLHNSFYQDLKINTTHEDNRSKVPS